MKTLESTTQTHAGGPHFAIESSTSASGEDLAAETHRITQAFIARHGRPPRLLGIGNIANNAYNNAKILRRFGWDCDVVCYDYYHIMGCPEWEDADFAGTISDQFHPSWEAVNLRGFRRPRWFVQGPQRLCLQTLLARREGRWIAAAFWSFVVAHFQDRRLQKGMEWYHRFRRFGQRCRNHVLGWFGLGKTGTASCRQTMSQAIEQGKFQARVVRARLLNLLSLCEASAIRRLGNLGKRLESRIPEAVYRPGAVACTKMGTVLWGIRCGMVRAVRWGERLIWHVARLLYRLCRFIVRLPWLTIRLVLGLVFVAPWMLLAVVRRTMRGQVDASPPGTMDWNDPHHFDRRADELVRMFGQLFPDRADPLTLADVQAYRWVLPTWRQLLAHYDLVVGYSTDGVYPLLGGKRPFVAFEHGTIRNIPFENTSVGRVCALTYRLADAAMITNCDNILAAGKLGLDNHRFVPHPINEDWRSDEGWRSLRADLQQRLATDFIVFHPSRQHWEAARHPDWEKGNDIFIRGFARFVHEVCPTASAVFVDWGKTVAESKALLAELRVADRVLWIEPQPTPAMIRYIRASDVVADQFYLGAFGGVMPKAMAYGRPSLIYLDEDRHRWCFPEMPPLENTRTDDDVFVALERLYRDPDWRERLVADGLRWYGQYHSNDLIAHRFADVLRTTEAS